MSKTNRLHAYSPILVYENCETELTGINVCRETAPESEKSPQATVQSVCEGFDEETRKYYANNILKLLKCSEFENSKNRQSSTMHEGKFVVLEFN